jgi:fucose permease
VQYIGFTLAVLVGGALSDRFGQARMLRIALLGVAVAASLFGSVWAYWSAVLAVLLIGIFGSIMENAVTALAMASSGDQDKNNILVQVAFSAGAIVLPLLYYFSFGWFHTWRPPYFIVGLLALMFCIFSPGHLATSQAETIPLKRVFAQYLSFFKNPAYLIAPVAMFLYVGAEIGLWAFAPVFFENNGYGVSSAVISSVLIWFLMMLGRMATAWFVEKFNIIRTMLMFAVLAMVSLVMMMLSSGVWAVVWTAAAGFACAPFFPLIVSWMTRITGEKSSSMIAFTMACGTLGPVLLGGITGVLGQQFGTQYIMLLPLVCFAGIFILLLVFGKRGEKAGQ